MTDPKTPPQGAPLGAAGESDKANGTAMYTVGCKLPNGLYLELGKPGDDDYTRVRLEGSNGARIVGGFGLTPVSKAFWDKWVKKNAKLEFVKKGMVFAMDTDASAVDFAKERAELKHGMEPLDPLKGLANVKGPDGKPLVEVDASHFAQGRQDMAQFGRGAAR